MLHFRKQEKKIHIQLKASSLEEKSKSQQKSMEMKTGENRENQ